MSCLPKNYSPLYRKIRTEAIRLVHKYIRANLMSKASGPCADCGAGDEFVWDHRDYSDALNVQAVCYGCNYRRGQGIALVIDPDTLNTIRAA